MTYNYVPASRTIVERARATATVCRRFGTTLPAAAIQFPLRHAAVAGVLVGMRTSAEVAANAAYFREPLPAALWQELDRVSWIITSIEC